MHILLYEYLHRQLAYFAYVFTVGFTSRFINDDVTHNAASMHYSALRILTMSSTMYSRSMQYNPYYVEVGSK